MWLHALLNHHSFSIKVKTEAAVRLPNPNLNSATLGETPNLYVPWCLHLSNQ